MPPSTLIPLRWQGLRCQSCTVGHKVSRSISSSLRALAIGPESPKFIEVPQSLQPSYPPKRRIKGVLPTPRNVFHRRGPRNLNPEYLAAVTPEPKPDASAPNPNPSTAAGAQIAWKERMAATRRRNLREGLTELYNRKKRMEHFSNTRSRFRRESREALVYQKEREDERLTNPTILHAMKKFQHKNLPDPERNTRVQVKTHLVKRKQHQKAVERMNALHSLYMQARNFITTEADLDAAIERIFVPRPTDFMTDVSWGHSVWNKGAPETVQKLLNITNKDSAKAMEFNEGSAYLTNQRMKRIQEELTGGKM